MTLSPHEAVTLSDQMSSAGIAAAAPAPVGGEDVYAVFRPGRVRSRAAILPLVLFLAACSARPGLVSPGEILSLRSQVEQDPTNGPALLRLSAALYADGRCAEALPIAERGRAVRPADPLGPLVIGQCYEREGRYDEALTEYARFLAGAGDASGAEAVRSRERIARRMQATEAARRALANEADLADVPSDEPTIAILPPVIAGDQTYAPLSIGLAALMVSDLQSLGRFRLVERVQIDALLAELQLGAAGRLDAATTVRVGRLVRANRMVQGIAEIASSGGVRFEASVVEAGGAVRSPESETGRLQELLALEKRVVVGIAEQLGPPLTLAERTRILDNGTQNLIAFLAYSRGLEAESRGDYATAASYYSEAVRADPGFTQARQAESNAAADAVVSAAPPEAVTTVASDAETAAGDAQSDVQGSLGNTLSNAVTDVASTHGERVTQGVGDPSSKQQINQLTNVPTAGVTQGNAPIQVLIRIPLPIPVR